MGRKRGSSNKKSRSKRSSTNTSPTNTPASFTAAAIGPPPSSVSEESNNSQPVTASLEAEETQNKEDGAPTATKVEPKAVADLDSEIVEEQPSEDVSTAAADGEALGPHTDDGQPEVLVDATAKDALVDSTQYNIDVASAVATSNCETEDLLDDIYTYGEDNTAHTETDMGEQPQLDACDEQVVVSRQNHTTDAAGAVRESTAQVSDTLGSLNLEDSEAVLLASNLEDSIYRSAINDRITDEMHVVEKSQESESMKVDHENAASVVYSAINAVSLNKASREYVVTPSAFATDSEPSVVTHVNQESATNAFDGETEAAADMVNIMSSEIYAAARAGGMETSTKSGGASNYNDWQMSESYVHVSQDLNSGSMSSRGGSEKAERATSEAMDNAKASAKDAANKASDKAKDAGDKANRAAKDAADSTGDAANRAKDIFDDASKSVKGAASRANTRAHDAIDSARESGGRFAKRAMNEANEAEKELEKQAKETSPAVLRTLGIVAAALAVASGYYFRLPGRDNQRLGFAGGIASAIIGLGTLATAFVKNSK